MRPDESRRNLPGFVIAGFRDVAGPRLRNRRFVSPRKRSDIISLLDRRKLRE
jgi:hypothetical protein